MVHDTASWFVDYVNYLVGGVLPYQSSYQQNKRFLADVKHYIWEDPLLFKACGDGLIRRCVPEEEMTDVLNHCHSRECGGHMGATKTTGKVLQSGFFWPTLFKEARAYVM